MKAINVLKAILASPIVIVSGLLISMLSSLAMIIEAIRE